MCVGAAGLGSRCRVVTLKEGSDSVALQQSEWGTVRAHVTILVCFASPRFIGYVFVFGRSYY